MTKEEFIEILKKLNIPTNEGIQNDKYTDIYPRLVFWDYVWDDVNSSNDVYKTVCTYQVSFFSRLPRDKKLIELKHLLNDVGLRPIISHEYVEENKDKYFHSYFSIDLIEEI